jgi:hypothetical protein
MDAFVPLSIHFISVTIKSTIIMIPIIIVVFMVMMCICGNSNNTDVGAQDTPLTTATANNSKHRIERRRAIGVYSILKRWRRRRRCIKHKNVTY